MSSFHLFSCYLRSLKKKKKNNTLLFLFILTAIGWNILLLGPEAKLSRWVPVNPTVLQSIIILDYHLAPDVRCGNLIKHKLH